MPTTKKVARRADQDIITRTKQFIMKEKSCVVQTYAWQYSYVERSSINKSILSISFQWTSIDILFVYFNMYNIIFLYRFIQFLFVCTISNNMNNIKRDTDHRDWHYSLIYILIIQIYISFQIGCIFGLNEAIWVIKTVNESWLSLVSNYVHWNEFI